MELEHVQHTDLRHGYTEQFGTLIGTGTEVTGYIDASNRVNMKYLRNEQTTIRATVDGNLLRTRVLVFNQILSRCTSVRGKSLAMMIHTSAEVIEAVLFLVLGACLVPLLAILSTTTNVGHDEDAVQVLQQHDSECAEVGLNGDAETSVTVH